MAHHTTSVLYPNRTGSLRILLPAAADSAFATAGAVGGTPGSPMPVGVFHIIDQQIVNGVREGDGSSFHTASGHDPSPYTIDFFTDKSYY